MNIYILMFLAVVTLTSVICAPASDSNDRAYKKDTVSKSSWDINGNLTPSFGIGPLVLKANIGVDATGHNNANLSEIFLPINPLNSNINPYMNPGYVPSRNPMQAYNRYMPYPNPNPFAISPGNPGPRNTWTLPRIPDPEVYRSYGLPYPSPVNTPYGSLLNGPGNTWIPPPSGSPSYRPYGPPYAVPVPPVRPDNAWFAPLLPADSFNALPTAVPGSKPSISPKPMETSITTAVPPSIIPSTTHASSTEGTREIPKSTSSVLDVTKRTQAPTGSDLFNFPTESDVLDALDSIVL